MKAKQISDTTLKITISMNDLEERGMELSDFIMPQEKTEDFFYSVLEEIDLPDHFKLSGMLSFRVTPKKDRIDIFVTKSDMTTDFSMDDFAKMEEMSHLPPEEFLKTLEQEMYKRGDKEALDRLAEAEKDDSDDEPQTKEPLDYVHFVLFFEQLEQVMSFAKTIYYPVETAELYKYNQQYHLTVLFYVEHKSVHYPDQIYARILEHAKISKHTRAFLREHATLLREGDVLAELADVEV